MPASREVAAFMVAARSCLQSTGPLTSVNIGSGRVVKVTRPTGCGEIGALRRVRRTRYNC